MTSFTFAHLADIHLGSFREQKLKNLQINQFIKAIDEICSDSYDFVVISGDIFNVPLPPLEYVELVIEQMKKLQELNIPVFVIGGSHDYSLTHKSFIQILDSVGIWRDVGKWESIDSQTVKLIPTTYNIKGINIEFCGVLGKKNGLDSKIYQKITNSNSQKENSKNIYSIFMFHSTIKELLQSTHHKQIPNAYPSSILPQNFNYYAGGHIHYPNSISYKCDNTKYDTSIVAYSGPIFPNSFSEFKDSFSGFYKVKVNCLHSQHNQKDNTSQTITFEQHSEYITLPMITITQLSIDCSNKLHSEIEQLVEEKILQLEQQNSIKNSMILFELYGELNEISKSVPIDTYISKLYELGAYVVLKNTLQLTSKKITHKHKPSSFSTAQELELVISKQIISTNSKYQEYISNIEHPNINIAKLTQCSTALLQLDTKKQEEETNYHYEERVVKEVNTILNEHLSTIFKEN
ncbi:MAG: metallophosphoesterase [Nanoarchaeota archaeon]|nr:metallophosphoesterase [Nanoarchaeota archaeon]